jgi:hypothetical protein
MIDTTTEGFDWPVDPIYYGSSAYMEIGYGVSHRSRFVSSRGDPLAHTEITMTIDGDRSETFRTDGDGWATFDLLEEQFAQAGSGIENDPRGPTEHVLYRSFTFSALGFQPQTFGLEPLKGASEIILERLGNPATDIPPQGLSGGVVAAIVIVVLLVVGITAFLVVWIVVKRRSLRELCPNYQPNDGIPEAVP